jgi:serine/threonine-protein kinase
MVLFKREPGSVAVAPPRSVTVPAAIATASVVPAPSPAQEAAATAELPAVVRAPTASAPAPHAPLTGAKSVAAAPSKDERGTLLAMATGGSCAFFVDGASQGTSSKVSLQVKAGTHAVMCRPTTRGFRSRSTPVKRGETSLVVFNL